MFKKLTVICLSVVLCFCIALPVTANATIFVNDDAGLFRPQEIAALEEMAATLEKRYDVQAVIVTVDSLNGMSAQNYADDFYDNAGYGSNGVLFLLDMSEREWYISTTGTVAYTLTDYGIQQIGEESVSYFSDDLWFDGFSYFLSALPTYLTAIESGNPIDGYADYSEDYYHGKQDEILYYKETSSPSILFSLLCGIVVSGVVVLIMRLCMNSKRPERCASVYMKEGSWKLTQQRDIFLYSNISKIRKQDPPENKGGGSSVHHSSNGRSHGGGGGKF